VRILGQRARDREYDVVRSKRRPVVELDIGPKLETPSLGVDLFPRGRQRWLDREIAVASHQRLVDLADHAGLVKQRQRVRIERLRIEGAGEAQCLRPERAGGQERRQQYQGEPHRAQAADTARSYRPGKLRSHMISK
jgi:hypothetical protein